MPGPAPPDAALKTADADDAAADTPAAIAPRIGQGNGMMDNLSWERLLKKLPLHCKAGSRNARDRLGITIKMMEESMLE
jgi:hypothetical protein